MVHQAVFALVHEFDRIFDRDDVVLPVLIRVIDHRGQRGGFAGTGGPVTTTSPLCSMANFFSTAGRGASNFSKSSKDRTLVGICRKTAAMPFF